MISCRVYGILKELNNNRNSYTNSNELSTILGVSSRTVKRDIKELYELLKVNGGDLESTNQGYKLIIIDEDVFSEFINGKINKNNDENVAKLDKAKGILELILSNKYITQDNIAEELYISRSSISKEMVQVKKILSDFKISISNKPHYGYILEGEEINIRNCMVRFLTKRNENNEIVISETLKKSKYFLSYDLLKDVKDIFKKLNIVKNDIEVGYITRYILISMFRIRNKCEIKLDNNINISLDNNTILASKEITSKIKERFEIDFSFEETLYISYIIGNNDTSVQEINNSKRDMEEMVIHAINKIKQVYDMDFFRDDALIKGIINHLYTSYSRYYLNVTLDNPLMDLIKSKYIEAYNYSILFSEILKCDYKINMTEEDIGYIALHFAAFLERASINNNFKAIIVCSSGVGTAELLKTRMAKKFPSIVIKGVYPIYILDSLDLSDIDFVISTVNLDVNSLEKEIINVSTLLTYEDVEKINEHLEKQRDYEYLQELMSEDIFITNIDADTKEEVLDIMTEKIIKSGVINEETKDLIIEREKVSSTEINELVAIPHSITGDNKKSSIVIGILNKPIKWDKAQVQLVFLGVLDPKVKKNRKVFTMLYKLTKSTEKVKKLVEIREFEYFKKKLFK